MISLPCYLLRYKFGWAFGIRPRKSCAKIKVHFDDSTCIKTIFHMVTECEYGTYQSGTGRKTFQAKSMPFWKEKTSNLTISLWKDFPSNSFFTENWKVFPSILMTSFGWKTLPKHHFHCKFGIRSAIRSQG